MTDPLNYLVLAALLTAPVALAREGEPTIEDAAWIDCPPDVICVTGAGDPARGPDDGSCENCRSNDEMLLEGSECAAECESGPAPTCDDDSGTEVCQVEYMTADSGAAANGAPGGTTAKTVPAPAIALGILALAGAAALSFRRR